MPRIAAPAIRIFKVQQASQMCYIVRAMQNNQGVCLMTAALTETEIMESLSRLSAWRRDDDRLVKTFKFDSYLAGLAFASAAGVIAEGLNHHPDIAIRWRKVTLSLTTHDAGNKLTKKDFATAAAIDALGYPKG